MARYTRIQITDLCKQIEKDANNIVSLHPAMSGRMKTMVLLLKLMVQLADIEEVDSSCNVLSLPVVHKFYRKES